MAWSGRVIMVWLIACVAVDKIRRYSDYEYQNNNTYNGNTIKSPALVSPVIIVVVDWKFLHDINFWNDKTNVAEVL